MLLLLGLAGGAAYNWASSIFAYNREAWMTDIQTLQAFDYQSKSLEIVAHSMARDQVRDRTTAAITRLNNYILVTTLIAGLNAEMFVEGSIPPETADFVVYAYMLSLGSSLLYLAFSTIIGVAAQEMIYKVSTDLLTNKVPPPWHEFDEDMKDRERAKMTGAFEKQKLSNIFMPPLLRRLLSKQSGVGIRGRPSAGLAGPSGLAGRRRRASRRKATNLGAWGVAEASPASIDAADGGASGGGDPDDGTRQLHAIRLKYDWWWTKQEKCTSPLKFYSQRTAALGLHSLLSAFGYLCMATMYGEFGGGAWAPWAVQVIFPSLNIMLTKSVFELEGSNQCWLGLLHYMGPLCCALAAVTPYTWLDRILIPICFVSHLSLEFTLDSASFSSKGRWQGVLCEAPPLHCAEEISRAHARVTNYSPTMLAELSMDTYGSSEDPGEDMEGMGALEHHAEYVAQLSGKTVFGGGVLMRIMWTVAALWASWKAIFAEDFGNSRALFRDAPSGPPIAAVDEVQVRWPSIYFRPHAIVCPGGQRFFVDEFRVFSSRRGQREVEPYDCTPSSTILDVASQCDSRGCWPLLLLAGQLPMIYDCRDGATYSLLQSTEFGPARRFAMTDRGEVYASHNRSVLRYEWVPHRHGWAPMWSVLAFSEGSVDAMDVTGRTLLIFRSEDARTVGDGGTVEMLNLRTGEPCGIWELPPAVTGGGCGEDARGMLLLTQSLQRDRRGAREAQLLRARLGHDEPSGCPGGEEGAETVEAPGS